MEKGFKYLIAVDQQKCTGCSACQLACSFHHTKDCGLGASCIRIDRDNGTGRIETTILEECCDMCMDQEHPLCIRFCAPGALFLSRKRVAS